MASTRKRNKTKESARAAKEPQVSLSEETEEDRIFELIVEPPQAEVKATNFDSLASYRLRLAQLINVPSTSIALSKDEIVKTDWVWTDVFFYPQTIFFDQPQLLEQYAEQLFERKPAELKIQIVYLKLALNPDLEDKFEKKYHVKSHLRGDADYELWYEGYEEALKRDKASLDDFKAVAQELKKIEPLPATQPMPFKQKQRFEPKIRRPNSDPVQVEASDWVEIIDRAIPTREVPVVFGGPADREIQYSVKGFTVFRKTDRGLRECGLLWDQFLDLQTLPLSFIPESGYRYLFRVFTPLSPRIPANLSKAMSVRFTYTNVIALIDINNQIYKMTYIIAPDVKTAESQHGMTIEFPPEAGATSSVANVIAQLERAFPMLEFGRGKSISVFAIFQIDKVDLNWIVFLDMMRRDPLFQRYLVVNERKQGFPMKKKVYVIFTQFTDRALPKKIQEQEAISLNINAIPRQGDRAAHIEVIATIDRNSQLQVLIPILQRLFQHYRQEAPKYRKELESYVGPLPETKFKTKNRQKNLLVTHPIFSLPYWSTAPKYRKIEIVSAKEPGAFPLYNGPKPLFYFRCLSKTYSVPDSIPNPDYQAGEEGYKYLPYCRHPEEVEGAVPILEKAETELSADSIMVLNRTGLVNDSLVKVLNNILPEFAETSTYIRAGNIAGFNSLLGCVLIAINDDSLQPANLASGKNGPLAKIRALRIKISESIEPAFCAQENWTKTDPEIREALRNFDVPLESRAYYRAIEEFFGIHLFIFKIIPQDNNTSRVEFEIPFAKYFSLRRFHDNRPCLLIERVEPKKGENEGEPQYQLLMRYEDNFKKLTQRVYPPSITVNAIELYHKNYSVYLRDDQIHNLPLGLDTRALLPEEIGKTIGQVIDEAGKCRGFIFDDGSVLFPPTAPYELPRRQIVPTSLDGTLLKIFRKPSAVSKTEDQLIGLWFNMVPIFSAEKPSPSLAADVENYFFIPILPTTIPQALLNLPNLPTYWEPGQRTGQGPLGIAPGENEPGSITVVDQQQDFERNYRSIRILYQVLRWLVALRGGTEDNVVEIEETSVYQPDVTYTFDLPRMLPDIEYYEDALTYLTENSKGLVTTERYDRRLILPSVKILTQIKISLWRSNPLWRFINPRDPNRVRPLRVIPNYYVYRSDFQPGIIFGSAELEEIEYGNRSLEATETLTTFNFPSFISWGDQVFLFIPSRAPEEERIEETARLYQYFRGVEVPTDRVFVFGFDAKRRVLIPIENRTGTDAGTAEDYLPITDRGLLIPLL